MSMNGYGAAGDNPGVNNTHRIIARGRGYKIRDVKQQANGGGLSVNVPNSNRPLFSPPTYSQSTISLGNPLTVGYSQAQKRKSPNLSVMTNDDEDEDLDGRFEDVDERYSSNPNRRPNLNSSQNNPGLAKIIDSGRLTTKKAVLLDEGQNIVHSYVVNGQQPVMNLISDHVRKYATVGSNAGIGHTVPDLKAVYQGEYGNLNFPIGVKACRRRDWLIVCASAANCVKVFNRSTGELLHTIAASHEIPFHRPSAVLINYENNAEMFVKDDHDIYVFEMDGFKVVRKFGYKKIKRPCKCVFGLI
jgi:hypothetical protein